MFNFIEVTQNIGNNHGKHPQEIFVPSNGTPAKTTTMSQESRSGIDESNILAGRRTRSGRLSEKNHLSAILRIIICLLIRVYFPRNSTAVSPPYP